MQSASSIWSPPLSSPASWNFRELDIDFDVSHESCLHAAIGIALRRESPLGDMTIEVVHATGARSKLTIPSLVDSNTSWVPLLRQEPIDDSNIAIVEETDATLSDVASRLGLSTAIRMQTQSCKRTLQLCFSARSTLSSWFLIHVARALRLICTRELYPTLEDLSSHPLDAYLRTISIYGEDISSQLLASPSNIALHERFAQSAQIEPLAEAVANYGIRDGHVYKQQYFSYGELLACALILANKLVALNTDKEACIPITSTDPAMYVIMSLAVSISGRCSVSVSADCSEMPTLDERSGALLQSSAAQLLSNASRLLYDDDMWGCNDSTFAFPSADPSLPALWLSVTPPGGESICCSVSHTKLATVVMRRRASFEVMGAVKVLLYRCHFNNWTTMFTWETFFVSRNSCIILTCA